MSYEDGYDPRYGYNKNAFAHKTVGTAVMGKVVQLIATPIGLVSEAISRSDKQRAAADVGKRPELNGPVVDLPPDQADHLVASGQAIPADGRQATHELVQANEEGDELEPIELDEKEWALDDVVADDDDDSPAASSSNPPASYRLSARPISAGASKQLPKNNRLPFPVIIPQRRPGTKTRGFVHAYAPVLSDFSLPQNTFLSFLDDLHKHAQASPIFKVINIATGIAGVYPDLIVAASVAAVQIASHAVQETQERWRTNTFLDQVNRDVFVPRGLWCMFVIYQQDLAFEKDKVVVGSKTYDLGAQAVLKYGAAAGVVPDGSPAEGGASLNDMMKRLRVASGRSRGEAEMPIASAPLVFPALEKSAPELGSADSNEKEGGGITSIKAKAKGASAFVDDYFDRRAQAAFAFENPNAMLTTSMGAAAPKFQSKYADPNNHTNKHFFTLITGGKWKAEPLGARRRWERAQRKAAESRMQSLKVSPFKRLLSEDVLYLMIVNMPTDAELAKAKTDVQAKGTATVGLERGGIDA